MICEKFLERNVTLFEIDEKFTFYSTIVTTLEQMKQEHTVRCVRINLKPLLDSIKMHAKSWGLVMGETLSRRVNESMRIMRNEIKVSMSGTISAMYLLSLSICFPFSCST